MCTLCSRKYSSSKTFEKHIRRCQDKRKLACPECHKEVIGQVQLDDHRRSHRGVDCNLCGERIPANSVSAHKAKVHGTSKTVKCDQCPFETKHQAYLSKHILKHVPKEKIDYPCDQCSKTFNMKRYLTQHKKTHENKMKNTNEKQTHPVTILCSFCDKIFAREENGEIYPNTT